MGARAAVGGATSRTAEPLGLNVPVESWLGAFCPSAGLESVATITTRAMLLQRACLPCLPPIMLCTARRDQLGDPIVLYVLFQQRRPTSFLHKVCGGREKRS